MFATSPRKVMSTLLTLTFLCTTTNLTFAQNKKFVTEPSPPFNYLENGEVAGPSYQIISNICAKLQVECAFDLTNWDQAIRSAKNAEVNGIFSIGKNAERVEWMYFSTPILETAYGVFVHKDNPLKYQRASDLAGYEVISYGPSNTSSTLENLSKSVPSMVVTVESKITFALKKFNVGRYAKKSALYLNRDVVNDLVKELNLKNIRYAGDDKILQYFVGFPKAANREKFVRDFNRVLEQFKQDGTLEKILSQFEMTAPQ